MRIRAALLVSACLLVAGCNSTPAQPTIKQKEEKRTAEVAKLGGWDKLFKAPDVAVGAAKQFGFRPTPYAAADTGFRSTGGPVMIAGSMSGEPSQVRFAAEGPSAAVLSAIRFDISITDAETAKDARARFANIVRDYLFQAGIEADALLPALSQGIAAKGDLAGMPYSIEKSQDNLAVIFTRTGAAAPDTSKPQGN